MPWVIVFNSLSKEAGVKLKLIQTLRHVLFPISFLLFFAIFQSSLYGQTYPLVHDYRPRIMADSARIAWLKSNIGIPGDCQTTYNNFLYAYNNWWINDPQLYLVGSDSTTWTWDWSSQWAGSQAIFTVVLSKITDDPLARKRCRFLARQAINRIDTASFPGMEWYAKENLLRQMSDAGSILLDWCYDDLPASLRQQFVQSHYKMMREFMNTFILSSAGNSYVSSHNAWNTIYCNQNSLVLYDAAGLSPAQKDTVNQWYQAVYDKWVNGFLPCYGYYRDDDGGWNWGAAYAMWSLVDQFQLFENMRTGTDKNFYTDLPWVKNSINQYWYFIQPDGKCIHLGDGLTGRSGDRVDYLHARIFNDPKSLWFAQYWSQADFTPNTINKFTKLLYKDFTAATVAKPSPALDWWSDKTGLSVSFSSWNPDACMLTYFCSPSKRAAHEHRDNNSFAIFKNTPLLLDAGHYDTYGGTHYRNYYQRTIAHNSILVYDATEQYSCFGSAASNDGGQKESAALMNYGEIFLPQNQRGKWIQYAAGAGYEYNVSDAQLSYDANKLDFFRRRLLFLKPNKVIVVDNVHLKNTATAQRDIKWIAHTANKPMVNGSITQSQVTDHIITYSGKEYTAKNGNGSIALKTLLPLNTKATLVGGTGYEYWVDGNNYPPLSPPDTSYYTPGKWRIEVEPLSLTDSVVFLHTISVGDSTDVALPGGLVLQTGYSVGADWNDTLYFFPAKGDTAVLYHAFTNVAGSRNVGIFAADLKPGFYFLKVDGIVQTTVATDSNGIIQGSLGIPPGNHTIEISYRNTATLSGQVCYNNGVLTPLYGVSVCLQNAMGDTLATAITSVTGFYSFDMLPPGNYSLSAASPAIPAGFNSSDALLVMKHYVHISLLEGLFLKAASVRTANVVNALDALFIQRRFSESITSFPKGDWLFEEKQFALAVNQSASVNLLGLSYGDVNGSNIPEAMNGPPCPLLPALIYNGKTYNTVLIGTQCWMRENLDAGQMLAAGQLAANNGIIEKYCYNNDAFRCAIYGGLYSWNELMQYGASGSRGLCPQDWHVPSDAEWTALTAYCGGEGSTGGKIKETGMIHWNSPNTAATNLTGFTALGAGLSGLTGVYFGQKESSWFWSSSASNATNAWARYLRYDSEYLYRYANVKGNAYSVRCIHD